MRQSGHLRSRILTCVVCLCVFCILHSPTAKISVHVPSHSHGDGYPDQIHPLIVFNIPSTDTQGTGMASKAHAIAGSWLLLPVVLRVMRAK